MVGLPARGKTYISQKGKKKKRKKVIKKSKVYSSTFLFILVCRYLNWLGINTKVFNVGNYRRQLYGAHQEHSFFDPSNPIGIQQRKEAASAALDDMLRWFEEDQGIVAIYDATNSTQQRRQWLNERLSAENVQVFFIESICQDESIILDNIKQVKLSSPDYANTDPEVAASDFMARIDHYKDMYETVTEQHYSYIKLINVGSQVIINMIRGYLESRIVYYLMNLHIMPRKIYMSRHGESMFNVHGKIGGDSELSPRGLLYADKLPELIHQNLGDKELIVWTSTLQRTIQTSGKLNYPKMNRKALDELDAGVCDGMTYEEIEVSLFMLAPYIYKLI
jgi:6-phosphofructo-2-kinase/fructose-2,6-biphosphatase 2